jgi:hypothetical protein
MVFAGSHFRSRSPRRRLFRMFASVVFLILSLGAGSAYAYWSASGTGSGTASPGSVSAVTVQAVSSGIVSSKLVPGGSADLLVQLGNPNSFPVTVVGIAANTSGTIQVVGGTGCTAANSGVSAATQTGLGIAVPTGTQIVHIPNGAAMTTSSASGCQGAVFQLPVTLTVRK